MPFISNNKKVLIIAYFFPPIGGGGIQRTIKFVKYLPDFNWEPIVLTIKNGLWISEDDSLIKDLPKSLKTYRTNCFGIKLYFKYLSKYSSNTKSIYDDWNILRKINKNILRIIYNLLLPDFATGWYFNVKKVGIEIINFNDIDLIYTTSPPFSEHLIGWVLKRKTKKKWIADFRDSYVSDPNITNDNIGTARRIIRRIYEKKVILNSDLIITATDPIRQDFLNRYHSNIPESKIITITNGFDKTDFENLPKINRTDKLTITYTGSFQGKRTPYFFLESLILLVRENENMKNNIHIRFIGEFTQYDKKLFSNTIIKDMIEVVEYVPYKNSLAYQCNSDINLLIISARKEEGGDQIFTGKIFEYIFAGKPIFALVPDGIAKNLIISEKLGVTADPNDIIEIKSKLLYIYGLWKKKQLSIVPNPDLIKKYERRELTRMLSNSFNKLVELNNK